MVLDLIHVDFGPDMKGDLLEVKLSSANGCSGRGKNWRPSVRMSSSVFPSPIAVDQLFIMTMAPVSIVKAQDECPGLLFSCDLKSV